MSLGGFLFYDKKFPKLNLLKFWSKREVACIAQAWYDISVFVKNGVNGSYPQGYIIGEYTA